ncbi:MarR family transcriptional regulator [Phycicoccus endophyticus]|uniref:MarR family transcriptional regulator n=1 Tax=Phycicoccus endophyticus TaxID=1690220 RepID=A0A7G9R1G9_9MICO|nr:MarR family transcriptional regulator [Phycicoccus endophyticus]NHI18768.1 MarR family transcriptional regulator [Phycicoccus endophyticus]QNN49444.1 MarR family transcriptional regulator [Phycicoccus endophyticus]GGL36713.1 transcriptional regulator [Phycicoccus endophyticus]
MSGNPSTDVPAGSAEELDAIVGAVLVASRALVGVSARSLADVEDTVTLTQFRALVVLSTLGETRLNTLAERLGVGASSALRTVDRLLAAGLVTRRENARDRRAVAIALTRRGRSLVDTVTARRREAIAAIVEQMPADRRAGLVAALTAFAEAADEPVPELHEVPEGSW